MGLIQQKGLPSRVAILRNYDTQAAWGNNMLDSIGLAVQKFCPEATIDIFHPITGGSLPNSADYDLIILTGGLFNLTLPELEPWVAQTFDFIQNIVSQKIDTKLLGFCWGHQCISRALGGAVGWVKNKEVEKVGIHTVPLTAAGKSFFAGKDSLELYKFHKRVVETPGEHLIPLAEENEILLSSSNQILTFQGHPEMNSLVAEGILDTDGGAYSGGKTVEEMAAMRARFFIHNDGPEIFERIMDWTTDSNTWK